MISNNERIEMLVRLGKELEYENEAWRKAIQEAQTKNPWFTPVSIQKAFENIRMHYLDEQKLMEWVSRYAVPASKPRTVALIMAGNIPMVGFHDILCAFIAGHHVMIKMSSRDDVLIPFMLSTLVSFDERLRSTFSFVERIRDYDAVIATGSDLSASHFKRYFGHVPHLIRGNRNGVAIVNKDISDRELTLLGEDMLSFFGLGCRNVSKLYLEEGFKIERLFEAIKPYSEIIHHNKYRNNYDYNYALYLMNKEDFKTNDFLIVKRDEAIPSRIASVHFEEYTSIEEVTGKLKQHKNNIQCVVSSHPINGFEFVPFGKAQQPSLGSYADGKDTLSFLLNLENDQDK